MIIIEIPVEPHVRKYLVTLYGEEYKASKKSLLGFEVLKSLTKKYEKPELSIPHHYKYKVLVPEFYFKKNGHTVPRNNLQHLGISMGVLFDMAMCQFLDMRLSKGGKALPELKEFLKFHNIGEDDVKVETLYKVYQRHCNGPINAKKKSA